MNRADALGSLSLLVQLPWFSWRVLRFVCQTCTSREYARYRRVLHEPVFDRTALIKQSDFGGIIVYQCDTDPWTRVIPGNRREFRESGGGAALALPFDPLLFRDHLCHEICPEWDARLIGEPVRVQDVSPFEKKPLSKMSDHVIGGVLG